MKKNINTKDYWENRFLSGNWNNSGRKQTREYAMSNVANINISSDFSGSILDFGCALGDAIPIYATAFPNAVISGTDISQTAIKKCISKYGSKASFFSTEKDIDNYDIIIASHIMEHLDDDINIVKSLLNKCTSLFIFVPYKESPLYIEHVNYYDEDYYTSLNVVDKKIFTVSYQTFLPLKSIIMSFLIFKPKFYYNFKKNIVMFQIKGNR